MAEPSGEPDRGGEPVVREAPVGLTASGTRTERDSLGEIDVPADRYWGAQTQRALEHFAIGTEPVPIELIRAYGRLKRAAAVVNTRRGLLPGWLGELVARVAGEVAEGLLDEHFPLRLWQSGSGTQTNMNVNEVIANRCLQLLGARLGSRDPVHPNDHVNRSQSSNDTFVTAMHLATLELVHDRLLPALVDLHGAVAERAQRWSDVVKLGRTHLQDAVPLTVGQEWSGYAAALAAAISRIRLAAGELGELAVGGTAVGTGLNAPPGFGAEVAAELAARTGQQLSAAGNPFAAQAGLDAMVAVSAAIRSAAVVLTKIANDLRWLASGPRGGLGELVLPANEPGSSIMPGKVNPSQCEVMVMVCLQVTTRDTAVALAGGQGQFELNTMRPLVAGNVLGSARELADAVRSFHRHCIEGLELDRARIAEHLERSLMLVTALAPVLGYDRAAGLAEEAHRSGRTLREVVAADGALDADEFDRLVDPRAMTG